MLDTIQRILHKVRTAYGSYNITYDRDIIPKEFRYFMMVTCQGSDCVPQLWSIISFIDFSALRTQGFGIHFVKSFTNEIAQLVGFRYVDDCDIIQSDYNIESTHSQIQLSIS